MIFVEVFRLLLVIAGTIGGLTVGNDIGRNTTAPVIGITLGALASYLLGGIIGRLIDRGLRGAVGAAPVDAGQLGVRRVGGGDDRVCSSGSWPGSPSWRSSTRASTTPLVAAFAWVLCAAGVRIGVTKGQEIVRAAGFSHLRRPTRRAPAARPPCCRQLGGDGPLSPGARAVRAPGRRHRACRASWSTRSGPWPTAPTRCRRVGPTGASRPSRHCRPAVSSVWMNDDEVPELDDTGDRALALAHRLHVRLATCSAELAERAEAEDIDVVDLRRLAVRARRPTTRRVSASSSTS